MSGRQGKLLEGWITSRVMEEHGGGAEAGASRVERVGFPFSHKFTSCLTLICVS